MNTTLSTYINKFSSTKIWYYIENILVVGLLFYCIKSLTDYDNVYYQTWKNAAAAKAILAFTCIVFIIRKVKLLNWQSLIATLLFGVFALERLHFWADSEDILNAVKPQLAAEWLSLMIIIDMILYKNVNNLFKGVNYLAILYVLMTIGMIWRRHDRMDPIVLIFPLFLFALVKMDEEKSDWFMRRFIDGWFISFVYVVTRSFIENPYNHRRYYGYFLNIGQFGIYMICCLVVSIAAIIYCKTKYKRKSIHYLFSVIWLLAICYMLCIINTRTIMTGLLFSLAYLYLYARKDISTKAIVFRWIKLSVFTLILTVGIIISFKICATISDEWIVDHSNGILSPIVINIDKLHMIANTEDGAQFNSKIITYLDLISSYRISIIRKYSEYFNYDGNGSIGVLVDGYDKWGNVYWAYGAHNTYVQFLVEYGYISFIELILLILLSLVIQTRNYIKKNNSIILLISSLWLASMLGAWLGESDTFFFPITFFGFMFIARMLPQDE